MALTPRQQSFVEEYLKDLNATQAAIRAGYSPKTAQEQSSRLLSNIMVQAAVSEAMAARSKRTEITADRVLRELALIAFADPGDVMEWDPSGIRLVPSTDLTRDQRAILGEVAETKDGMRIKLNSKLDALGKLGQHLGMFKNDLSLNGDGPVVVQILKQTFSADDPAS